MIVYQANKDGFFITAVTADSDPLTPGAWLIPGGCTLNAPPEYFPGTIPRLIDDTWVIVPDIKGTSYWLADGTEHVLQERGIDLPVGALLSPPPPLLVDVKTAKRAEIINARDQAILAGFPYQGKTIDSNRDSVMSITAASVAALAAKSAGLPYSVTWTCADDSVITLDADGVLGMVVTLAQYADAQHTKGRPLKDAIVVATTAAEVAAITW